MASYREEKDPRMRYNMLLEFSSYLRQEEDLLATCLPAPLPPSPCRSHTPSTPHSAAVTPSQHFTHFIPTSHHALKTTYRYSRPTLP